VPAGFRLRHVANPLADRSAAYGDAERAGLNRAANDAARAEISSWPGYAPTPLLDMAGLAGELKIGRLWLKDEAQRFGLKSFKALGGAYAVLSVLRPCAGTRSRRRARLLGRSARRPICRASGRDHGVLRHRRQSRTGRGLGGADIWLRLRHSPARTRQPGSRGRYRRLRRCDHSRARSL
jgi:hypothetical protein